MATLRHRCLRCVANNTGELEFEVFLKHPSKLTFSGSSKVDPSDVMQRFTSLTLSTAYCKGI